MTIQSDSTVTNDESNMDESTKSLSVEEAADALYQRNKDARKRLSDASGKSQEKTETPPDDEGQGSEPADDADGTKDEDQEGEEGSTKGDPEDEAAEAKFADDSYKVKITIDGKDQEVDVKTLKRLFGQEQSLTRKSQEVSEAKKQWETKTSAHVTKLSKLTENAKVAWEPYSQVDWALAANNLSTDEYKALKGDAEVAYTNYKYVVEELDATMTDATAHSQTQLKEAGTACIANLQDEKSPNHIKGFDKAIYEDIRTFAVEAGLAQDAVNTIVEPIALKLIHDAMQWRNSQKKIVSIVTRPQVATLGKKAPLKAQPNASPSSGSASERAAMAKVRSSGSLDDATAAYELVLARNRKS